MGRHPHLALVRAFCETPECDGKAARDGKCWRCVKRQQRGVSLQAPAAPRHESPWDRLTEAAIAYADADPDDDRAFEAARSRLRRAAIAYGLSATG